MSILERLGPVALWVALVCAVAGAAVLRYVPAQSQTVAPPNREAQDNPYRRSAGSASEAALLICPIEKCPNDRAEGSQPRRDAGGDPDGTEISDSGGGGGIAPCPEGDCPPPAPNDGMAYCLALGCPTGNGSDRPVFDADPPPLGGDDTRSQDPTKGGSISSFDECVRAGYPVAESYPEQCVSPYGTFTRPVE